MADKPLVGIKDVDGSTNFNIPFSSPQIARADYSKEVVPNPKEVATLVVGGFRFNQWESVWVQHRYGEPFALFQFTAAEPEPFPNRWQSLRFYPDDHCIIELGGVLAMNGIIITRQVAYDKKSHGVQLQGKGITWWASKSSVDSTTGSYDDKNLVEIAKAVMAPYPSPVRTVGALDPTPFKRCSAQPGETCWDFIERLARPRGAVLGSDHLGNFLLIGDHPMSVTAMLVEGYNILRAQIIITKDQMFKRYSATGQTNNDGDAKTTSEAGEQMASTGGSAPVYSHKITPSEQPVWGEAELQARAESEALWHEGAVIEASITVQGWHKPNGDIWRVGEVYKVVSPMGAINEPLACQEATFTQDRSSGTTTTLKMVLPRLLKIHPRFANSEQPLVGNNIPVDPAQPVPQPPAPVPYTLPPGTRMGPNGIEELPDTTPDQSVTSGINF